MRQRRQQGRTGAPARATATITSLAGPDPVSPRLDRVPPLAGSAGLESPALPDGPAARATPGRLEAGALSGARHWAPLARLIAREARIGAWAERRPHSL